MVCSIFFKNPKMSVNSTLATGLQECIRKQYADTEFSDFTIEVENHTFRCHRFILVACSEYFRGLFRSRLNEFTENRVQLNEISKDTFEIIMKLLYTGDDVLTTKNILDTWTGTVRLQIGYLVTRCEEFVMKNISVDNVFDYLNQAKKQMSEKVERFARQFIEDRFELVRNTEGFLQLSLEDVSMIIQSDFLTVSTEDSVVEAILKWLNQFQSLTQSSDLAEDTMCTPCSHSCTQNINDSLGFGLQEEMLMSSLAESGHVGHSLHPLSPAVTGLATLLLEKICRRNGLVADEHEKKKQRLLTLISKCRLFLVSSVCLENLLKNELVISCRTAYDKVLEALLYVQSVERRHSPWLEAAVHRTSSEMKHTIVFACNTALVAYDLNRCTFFEIASLPSDASDCKSLAVFDNVVYLEYRSTDNRRVMKMLTSERNWVTVTDTEAYMNLCDILLVHGIHIYCFDRSRGQLLRCPVTHGVERKWLYCCDMEGESLVVFKKYILTFYTENNSIVSQCYDTDRHTIFPVTNLLSGPTRNMISFCANGDVFILQMNGFLWKVISNERCVVVFQLVSQLWRFNWVIFGAVVYKKQLFLFGSKNKKIEQGICETSAAGIFDNVKIVIVTSRTRSLPMIMHKSWLV